ncbi:MAG TPA: hypothetical protein DCP62_00145 [Erysipelotrichaceae bacterium]|nr:hypothetical protein [Erysipelotrichaceae bacterium]
MPSVTLYPSSHTLGTNGANFLNPTNLRANDGIYATVTQTAKNTTSQIYLEAFDASSIPSGSTINSIIVNVERKMSSTSSIQSVAIQAYKASVAMGTKTTNTTEPSTDTVLSNSNTGSWSFADLPNLRVLLENIRGNSTAACTVSYDYVSITVDYTEPVDTRIVSGDFGTNVSFEASNEKTALVSASLGCICEVNGGFTATHVGFGNIDLVVSIIGGSVRVVSIDGSLDVSTALSGISQKVVDVESILGASILISGAYIKTGIQAGIIEADIPINAEGMKLSIQNGSISLGGQIIGQNTKTGQQSGQFLLQADLAGVFIKLADQVGTIDLLVTMNGAGQRVLETDEVKSVAGNIVIAVDLTSQVERTSTGSGMISCIVENAAEALKMTLRVGGIILECGCAGEHFVIEFSNIEFEKSSHQISSSKHISLGSVQIDFGNSSGEKRLNKKEQGHAFIQKPIKSEVKWS